MPDRLRLHERDCAPCAAAIAVVADLASAWDPLDNWAETPAVGGIPGAASLLDEAQLIAAAVLHRFPIPGGTDG